MEKEQTFYQELKAKGYTRRQFVLVYGDGYVRTLGYFV